jgi:pyrimidine deaminase RibD-like protein
MNLEEQGIKIDAKDVFSISGKGSVGRMHIAKAMVKAGVVPTTSQAFVKYIGDKSPAYVLGFKLTPAEAIRLIKDAGGVAVLAHPYMLNNDELIGELAVSGLDGIEVYYPEHSQSMVNFYRALAAKLNLLVTGGSDFHGSVKPDIKLGVIKLPIELVDRLREGKMIQKSDEYYMRMAMKLALKAKGRTSPNPMVGALLVKGGRIIGKGFHARAGLAHAEIVALDEAGKNSRGATLYVTLEPCAHTGRTQPCVDRLIRSGIKEVVIGMIDPNPLNNGRGSLILRQNNIKVRVGVLSEKLQEINRSFIKYITSGVPFVTVKVAESLDGRIATYTGESKWITSDASRTYAHRIRNDYDAIMVGVNTVLRDNPRLNAVPGRRQPVKVIIDSNLSTPENSDIFLGRAR